MRHLSKGQTRQEVEGLGYLLPTETLSNIIGQCPSTVRRMCASGELPAVRIGRRWYVPKTRFIEFCEGVSNGKA